MVGQVSKKTCASLRQVDRKLQSATVGSVQAQFATVSECLVVGTIIGVGGRVVHKQR